MARIQIVHESVVNEETDAIVNAANGLMRTTRICS